MNKSLPDSAVLTVTCERDRWCFERQYIQMSKLCMPTEWWIVINEYDSAAWFQWFNEVQQLWPAPQLKITVLTPQQLPLADVLDGFNGYWRQQFYKLAVADQITHDLLVVIDSKNWLIKPWHPLMHRQSRRSKLEPHWSHFHKNREFAHRLWGWATDSVREILPPISWEPSEVKKMLKASGSLEQLVLKAHKFFGFGDRCPVTNNYNWPPNAAKDTVSEFMLYDYWMQKQQLPGLMPEELSDSNIYNYIIDGWLWQNLTWEPFDNVCRNPATYWITIKWHVNDRVVDQLKESIWSRTVTNSWGQTHFKKSQWLTEFGHNHDGSE